MPRSHTSSDQSSPLQMMLGAALIILALSLGRTVLIPIAFAILLSFILTPLLLMLQRRGVRRTYSVLIVCIGALLLIGGVLVAISFQLYDLATDLPKYRQNVSQKIHDVQGRGPSVLSRLFGMFNEISDELAPKDPSEPEPLKVEIKQDATNGPSSMLSLVAAPAINALASTGLIIALTVTILFYREDLRNRLLRLIGHGHLAFTTQAMDDAASRISRYLLLQIIVNSGFGFLFALGLLCIGVPYWFVWGVLAIILRFIPYLGTWLAAVVPLVVSIAVFSGWAGPILVLVLIVVLGVATNNVIEPMFISRSTGVSPIALVVAAAFWTWLWGPIGLVLSTPMSVCLAVVGRYVPGLEFLDVLLGTRPALDLQHAFYQRLVAQDETEATELAERYFQNHNAEELCDDVLLPALGTLRQDYQRGHVEQASATYVIETAEEIFEVVTLDAAEESSGERKPGSQVVVMGVAARGRIDVLALEMLDKVLGKDWRIATIPRDITEQELTQWFDQNEPVAVCIGTVAPGGLARLRSQCQRLRRRFPKKMKLIVGYWGYSENAETIRDRFKRHGADQVVFSLKECRNELTPLLRSAASRQVMPDSDSVQEDEL